MAKKTALLEEPTKTKSKKDDFRISLDTFIEEFKSRKIITGNISADIALGGGIPLGCTVLFGAKPKLGKSTCALQYAANAQNQFGCKVFFFGPEGRLTPTILNQIRGLKTGEDDFEIVRPPKIMVDGEFRGYEKWHAEQWWDKVGETIQDNPGSVGIVDSISNLASEKEVSEEMGYQERGRKQAIEAQFCRKFGDIIVPNQFTLFLIAQVQANTSGYGPTLQMKAGNAMQHQADILLLGKTKEDIKNTDGRIIGHDAHFIIAHSALGPPGEMVVPITYGYGIDNERDVLKTCIEWGMIQKAATWLRFPFKDDKDTTVLDAVTEDSPKAQGELQARAWLMNHPDHCKALELFIRSKVLG